MKIVEQLNPRITEDDLATFSGRHNLLLPQDYGDFLLRNNGGRPEPDCFPIEGLPLNPFGNVQVFFGINAAILTEDLTTILTELPSSVPHGILPVACNGGGDFICLDLRKTNTPVVFWDRRPFWGNNIWNEKDLYRIADSFESFLESMRDLP